MPGGSKDSSKTRVEPVFDRLTELDASGTRWLSRLLQLPKRTGSNAQQVQVGAIGHLEHRCWGNCEKKLAPPKRLLEWLIENAVKRDGALWGNSQTTISLRQKLLIDRDPEVIARAKQELSRFSNPKRKWFVFEGHSQPDVFLQTPELIVVIEGKRTERGVTTHTDWMSIRHQMIRHLDGAFEVRGLRSILGFFIVEGSRSDDGLEVPEEWRLACEQTVSRDVLEKSLPHRDALERATIASGYLGVTTWQRVCREFGIAFDQLPDVVGA